MIDSAINFPVSGLKVIFFPLAFVIVYFYYRNGCRKRKTRQIFFIVIMVSIWNLLSKLLLLVPYNENSSMGILVALIGLGVVGLPVSIAITDKTLRFIEKKD